MAAAIICFLNLEKFKKISFSKSYATNRKLTLSMKFNVTSAKAIESLGLDLRTLKITEASVKLASTKFFIV